jgi:serine protease Do
MSRTFYLLLLLACSGALPTLLRAEQPSNDPFVELAAKVKSSVVTISSVNRGGGPWGVGTGFAVGSDGVIATNFHVIGEHREFRVELEDGTICKPTEILAIDRSRDLVLFRIDNENIPTLPLGDSSLVLPGESVLSVGNPLGYGLSVSRGVVAAIRELEFGDGRPMVQVAIPIEAGSSGSPVVNDAGEVIAVLTIKSGGAMGFGVPSQSLATLLNERHPIPIEEWLRSGKLDKEEWICPMGGDWKEVAGVIKASGMGNGFGGRMICLNQNSIISAPFDLEVEVKLEDESGAAGLVFCSNGQDRHYGFYPTNQSLRLTCFNGARVFDWNIIETKPSAAYQPGDWNHLSVRVEQGGQILCKINGEDIFQTVDLTLKEGWVGFCKFREPGAQFRNFRISKRIPPGAISSRVRERAYELSQSLTLEEKLSRDDLLELADMGSSVQQALLDRAQELEKASERLRQSAEQVRIAQILNQLENLLLTEKDLLDEYLLLRAALLVAQLDNPHFHLSSYLKKMDSIALRISENIPNSATPKEKLDIVLDQLFFEYGFRGSTLDFHHRGNSYLNDVIDKRSGIPITLSLLLIELGKQMDLPIHGLSTPGHFLAFYKEVHQKDEDAILIDAFAGTTITLNQASELTNSEVRSTDLKPATPTEMISRILNNLLKSADWERDSSASLRYLNALVTINPRDRYYRTLRAMNFYGAGMLDDSLRDISFLLKEFPDDPSNGALIELKRRLSLPHQ